MRKSILAVLIISLTLSFGVLFNRTAFAESDDEPQNITVQQNTTTATPTANSQTLIQKSVDRVRTSWPWYLVRGSGIIAAIMLVILILSGAGLVTGHTFKILEPITAWASHRAIGIVFGISISLHIIGLLFDKFIPFNIFEILVPWLSNYKPVTLFGLHLGSLYVALGVLAFYTTTLIVITSLLWIEKKPYLWKITHLLSYMVMVFVFIHALYLGTDLAGGLIRWIWIALGVSLIVATVIRLWRAKTI